MHTQRVYLGTKDMRPEPLGRGALPHSSAKGLLAEARMQKGFTFCTLAEKAGVKSSQVHYWEHRQSIPSRKNMRKLSKALDIPLVDLLLFFYE